MSKVNKGLGRGLDALLSGGAGDVAQADDVLRDLNVSQLRPGKYQPRTHWDEDALNELAASIKAQGVMQPILAREVGPGTYEIIAGERRWRAARRAGLAQVPVLIRKVPDNVALAMALIENIQRENLNPLEEAIGIQRLIDEFQMTHQTAADAVGRSRSAATNLLRLLKLPQPVQDFVSEGKLDMGHARALLGLESAAQQIAAANKIVAEGLSVREAEQLVQRLSQPEHKPGARQRPHDRDILILEERIAEKLGTKVGIMHGAKGSGKLVIEYRTLDHLDDVLARLGVAKD
jgi:ParB family transcriptional regulator, chromosome partitioning protein